VLHCERLSGDEKLMNDLAMLGLEPAALGQREPLVRERKIGDGFECRLHTAELLLETGAERRERRCCAIRWAHCIERRRQQRPPLIRMLARAIGADEGERLLPLETVPLYRLAHGPLGVPPPVKDGSTFVLLEGSTKVA
jgi:hypothetical protein